MLYKKELLKMFAIQLKHKYKIVHCTKYISNIIVQSINKKLRPEYFGNKYKLKYFLWFSLNGNKLYKAILGHIFFTLIPMRQCSLVLVKDALGSTREC